LDFKNPDEGGQANVDKGKFLGMHRALFKKGEANKSSKVGLLLGSKTSIRVIRLRTVSDIEQFS
jgi:hypothetical protein